LGELAMRDGATSPAPDFLVGGGEMGKLIGSMDWSRSPLGPIESWPQSLRTTVSLCVASNFPISLAWGPKHIQIYNDGYWPICGAKHPDSMGQDFTECWASPWPVIGGSFERALAGHTSHLENQRMFLDRNGYLEETCFTLSFSPIRDESGCVGGVFHPVTDRTGKMLNERRARALRNLRSRIGKERAVSDVFLAAAQALGEHDLDVPFALFYRVDADGARATLVAHAGIVPNTIASPDSIDLAATPAQWPLGQVFRTMAGVHVEGFAQRFGPITAGPYPETPNGALVLPICPPGSNLPIAMFVAGVSARLPLTRAYREFFDLLANTIAAAVAGASAAAAQGSAELGEAKARLRLSEEKHRLLMAQAQDGVLVLDPEGIVLEINPSGEAILGRAREDILGRPLPDLLAVPQAQILRDMLGAGSHGLADLHLVGGDGKERNIEVSAAHAYSGYEEIVQLIARDVTERMALEKQLRQSQKMEAVGQLTGGVAHDFNNILTVIIGTAEILAETVSNDPDLTAIVKSIDEAAERGAQLTKRMLAFARKQPLQPRRLDLNEVVTRSVTMLQRVLGEDIAVKAVLAPDLWAAVADPSQIEDAVLNLAVNARDAMPNGGDLLIETANAYLDEHFAEQNDEVVPGDYVAVNVIDSGTGMSAEVIEHAFEPFFTTKEVGSGTGLGLSMVYGVVKQSRGHVKIYSELGLGTSVKLFLPRATGSETAVDSPNLAPRGASEKSETILVVEDDAAVRGTVVTMLENLGYRVRQAENGHTALDILRSSAEIDLLFSDVIMPKGMSGIDLLGEAWAHRPSLRALLTSGYSEHFIKLRAKLDRDVPLLGKPYGRQQLAQKIRAALDQAPDA
jgi:PAS domain S-box-containing protein